MVKNNRKKKIVKKIKVGVDIKLGIKNIFDYFDKEYKIPSNIGKLTPLRIRNLHAYWGNQYVHCQNMVSNYEANLKQVQLDRKRIFNRRYILAKSSARVSNDLARMKAENNKRVMEIDDKITELEISYILWTSLTESCRTFMQVCSRDQSWRQVEFDSYKNRLGQGK